MTEFKYEIGSELYSLFDGDWDGNNLPDQVDAWPVRKITERFVYVEHCLRGKDSPAYRFDRAALERDGYAYHPRLYQRLYVRPKVDWPLMLVESRPANQLEAS